MHRNVIISLVCFLVLSTPVTGQDWATPILPYLQRLDLRRLGHPDVNEIPARNTTVTALLTSRDGMIYGATTGDQAYLFLFNPRINKVRHLGLLPGAEGVHHALAEDAQGNLYIGTGKNVLAEFELTADWQGKETADKALWHDIKQRFASDPGGHLYRYNPVKSNGAVKLPDMPCDVEDLGIPVAQNAVYALTVNPAGTVIYGLTYPDGHFFVYDIQGKKFQDIGPIDEKIVHHGPERHWRSLPRALVCDRQGNVYTTSTGGRIVQYNPESGSITPTGCVIPGDYPYSQFYEDYAVVEYFAADTAGIIYGGSSDGHLFQFEPTTKSLINFGKPRASRRLRCLTVGRDGHVYLIAGERSVAYPCQAYRYNTRTHGFEDLGFLIVDRSPFYYQRGTQFDAMTTGTDGTIFIGESEYRSSLWLFIP